MKCNLNKTNFRAAAEAQQPQPPPKRNSKREEREEIPGNVHLYIIIYSYLYM